MKLPFQIDLSDKVAVITGAGGVICGTFAKAVAKTGAKVALLDINYDSVKSIEDEINKEVGEVRAMGIACNVLEPESVKEAHEKVLKAFGKCNILINGAGGNNPRATTDKEVFNKEDLGNVKTFFDIDKENFDFVFQLNFMGTLIPTQEFAKDMIDGGENTIINISSMNAFRPLTKIPAYSTAKAAISNFTQWLAVHFADVGIRVNAMAPGFFSTNQTRPLFYESDGVTPTPRSQKIISHTPLKRFGEVEDLIGTLLWLLSYDASAFVNGVVVPIDGGFAAYSGV